MRHLTLFPRIILTGLALMLGFCSFVAWRSADYQVERSMVARGTSKEVFDQLNQFRNWARWYPLTEIDPGVRLRYDGPSEGVGAVWTWNGNDKVGAGRIEIVESRQGSLLLVKTIHTTPAPNETISTFSLRPEGSQGQLTRVTWKLQGKHGFIAKALTVFVEVDETVGPDMELALHRLQQAVEIQQ